MAPETSSTTTVPEASPTTTAPATNIESTSPVSETSHALSSGVVGANGHLLWKQSPETDFQFLSDSGIDWFRSDFDWGLLEPSPGSYDWKWSDSLMRAASLAQVSVLAIIDYSAPWASSDPSGNGDVHYPPSDMAAYAGFAAQVVSRYGDGGDFWQENPALEERPLGGIEIWNEPFGHWFWKPNPDAVLYAEMVRATVEAVREVQPSIRILAAGDALEYRTDGQSAWLAQLLEADPTLPGLIDVWSIHPYPDPPGQAPWVGAADDQYSVRGRVAEAISTIGAVSPDLPIWITEIGWCTGGGDCGPVDEVDQSAFHLDVLSRVAGIWGETVEKVFVYSIDVSSEADGDREGTYGLRYPDGTPKPAWEVIARAAKGGQLPEAVPYK